MSSLDRDIGDVAARSLRRARASGGAADRQKVLLNELGNLPADKRETVVGKQRHIIDAMQTLIVALYPAPANDPTRARAKTMLTFGMINGIHSWMNPKGPLSTDDISDMVLDFALPA